MVNVAFLALQDDCSAVTCQPACSLYSCQMGGCFSKNWKLLPQPQLVMFTVFIPAEGKVKHDPAMFRLWVWLYTRQDCNHFQRWRWCFIYWLTTADGWWRTKLDIKPSCESKKTLLFASALTQLSIIEHLFQAPTDQHCPRAQSILVFQFWVVRFQWH